MEAQRNTSGGESDTLKTVGRHKGEKNQDKEGTEGKTVDKAEREEIEGKGNEDRGSEGCTAI